jgi:hypothetical protein
VLRAAFSTTDNTSSKRDGRGTNHTSRSLNRIVIAGIGVERPITMFMKQEVIVEDGSPENRSEEPPRSKSKLSSRNVDDQMPKESSGHPLRSNACNTELFGGRHTGSWRC